MRDLPLASLSLDADDLWAYLRTHGDATWEKHPSYLPRFYDLAFELFESLRLRITFFIVGFDATREANRPALASLAARGHEVGNHSFWHEYTLYREPVHRIDEEIARAEAAIVSATGQRPIGYRGPGFTWSSNVLEVLARRGYSYDASTLPTYLAPLARWYFLATAKLTAEQREQRQGLFGSFTDGLRSVRPYRWNVGDGRSLLEIPVTTMPLVKLPFHLSYLQFLARRSTKVMLAYLRTAIATCRWGKVQPSFLLHPLDLLGGDEVRGLEFFPGMDLPTRRKLELTKTVLGVLAEHFTLVPMSEHAAQIVRDERLPSHTAIASPVLAEPS